MKICNECGFQYSLSLGACPECGAPNIHTSHSNFVNSDLTNCPNCGAPVTNAFACEYCESVLPRKVQPTPQVVVNNNCSDNSSAGAAVGAALLGGIIGGLFGD